MSLSVKHTHTDGACCIIHITDKKIYYFAFSFRFLFVFSALAYVAETAAAALLNKWLSSFFA